MCTHLSEGRINPENTRDTTISKKKLAKPMGTPEKQQCIKRKSEVEEPLPEMHSQGLLT